MKNNLVATSNDQSTQEYDQHTLTIDSETGVSTDVQAQVPVTVVEDTSTAAALSDTTHHELDSILTRPVKIASGAWDSSLALSPTLTESQYTAKANAPWLRFDFPKAILDNSTTIQEKLSNFKYLRADLEIEMKVNTNPFQQGALLIVYNPYESYVTDFRRFGTRFLASASSLPHAILNVESGNSVKLRVPYANIYDYFDMNDVTAQFGTIQVYVLSPLVGATSSEVATYAVFARFINPEWYTPAPLQAAAKSSIVANVTRYVDSATSARSMISDLAKKFKINFGAEMVAQAGEGDVHTVGGLAKTVGDGIHTLAKGLSWTMRIAKGAASLFGFSKPTDTVMATGVTNLPGRYMGNVEGKDYSTTLAMIPDNAVDGSAMIPAGEDEMALDVITRRPNLVMRKDVSTEMFQVNNQLMKWEVSPFLKASIAVEDDAQSLCLGTFSYTSMLYRYWRGALDYTIHAIKTSYHSGRFVVVFFPGIDLADVPETLTDEITTCYNVIFDLKEIDGGVATNKYDINVPYISNQPWKNTLSVNSNGVFSPGTNETSTGSVGVYALTDLIAPDTVSAGITFVVEVCGGKDYTLAVPSMQIASGFGRVASNEVNDFAMMWLSRQWKSPGVIATGEPITINHGDNTPYIESGRNLAGAVGKEQPGLNGGYISDPIHVQFTTSSTGGSIIVYDGTVQIFCEFIGGYCITCGIEPQMFYTADSPEFENNGTSTAVLATSTSSGIDFSRRMIAQAGEGMLVPKSRAPDVTAATMGEYNFSLRSLIKRFSPVLRVTANVLRGYTPHMTQYEQQSGYRTVGVASPQIVPESHYSLVSNLFRFYVGGARLKLFNNDVFGSTQTALAFTESRSVAVSSLDLTPQVEQSTIVNNCTEVTIPYYGRTRCYVLAADQVDSQPLSRAVFFAQSATAVPSLVYEAGADDLAFFFTVGPPVVHYALNDRVTPPVV